MFFVLEGDFIFDWLELVELFRLYLGAIHVRGSIFLRFLFQTSY